MNNDVDDTTWGISNEDAFSGRPANFNVCLNALVLGQAGSVAFDGPPKLLMEESEQLILKEYKKRREHNSRCIAGSSDLSAVEKDFGGEVELNVKHEMLDIQKFAISGYTGTEKIDAKARLAVELGAKPARRMNVNYKELKVMRRKQKDNDKEQAERFGKKILRKSKRKASSVSAHRPIKK